MRKIVKEYQDCVHLYVASTNLHLILKIKIPTVHCLIYNIILYIYSEKSGKGISGLRVSGGSKDKKDIEAQTNIMDLVARKAFLKTI